MLDVGGPFIIFRGDLKTRRERKGTQSKITTLYEPLRLIFFCNDPVIRNKLKTVKT